MVDGSNHGILIGRRQEAAGESAEFGLEGGNAQRIGRVAEGIHHEPFILRASAFYDHPCRRLDGKHPVQIRIYLELDFAGESNQVGTAEALGRHGQERLTTEDGRHRQGKRDAVLRRFQGIGGNGIIEPQRTAESVDLNLVNAVGFELLFFHDSRERIQGTVAPAAAGIALEVDRLDGKPGTQAIESFPGRSRTDDRGYRLDR